jgi:hypothetical protein
MPPPRRSIHGGVGGMTALRPWRAHDAISYMYIDLSGMRRSPGKIDRVGASCRLRSRRDELAGVSVDRLSARRAPRAMQRGSYHA